MSPRVRRAEDCPYRAPAEVGGGDRPSNSCRLLAEIAGVEDQRLCLVNPDACESCCRSFPPSAEHINPVVASLLYELTSGVARLGGVPGCDRPRAEALNRLAARNLPSEEDCLGGVGPTPDRPPASDPDRLARLIPIPGRRTGPRVRTWAVGVTTAPRAMPTLSECLESLAVAGWPKPRLFVDGPVAIPEPFAGLPRTVREPRVGAWPSYFLALSELLMRTPEADAYMLVQDDALFFADPGVRPYLERILWPGPRPGIVSLFCSRAYTRPRAGWARFEGCWVWCALAFIFCRTAAQQFLSDPEVVRHRWSRQRNPLADIDWRIGEWAARNDVPIAYPTPSLVQHIGDVSTLWDGVRVFGNRRAVWFAGAERPGPQPEA